MHTLFPLIAFLFLFGAVHVQGQSDILISKGTGTILSTGSDTWVFDLDNQSYSRIDFFSDPPQIYTTNRDAERLSVVASFGQVQIAHMVKEFQDSTRVEALVSLEGEEEQELFVMMFQDNFVLAEKADITDLVVLDSLAVLGYGSAGFSVLPTSSSGGIYSPDFGDTLRFYTVTGNDTGYQRIHCVRGEICSLEPLSALSEQTNDTIITVDVLALDNLGPDSVILFIGSNTATGAYEPEGRGLRRGRLGERYFPKVTSMGLDTSIIQRIYVNPVNHLVWVFTQNRFYVSDDGGLTFRVPDAPAGIPTELVRNLRSPTMTFFGDTSILILQPIPDWYFLSGTVCW
ncbi:hypothetical protein ACFL5V_07355 [Fibrobacterota bacterium]